MSPVTLLTTAPRSVVRVVHDVVVDRGLQLAGFAVLVLAAVLSIQTR